MTAIRVLSYNVRYANRGDHHDAWHERRDAVGRLVRFHRPDVAAFQEPDATQRRDLDERLPEYALVGRGRNADGDGEGCPIAVRTDRWRVVDDGTFWLSETPTKPSTDWGAAHPRVATWARVRERDDADGGHRPTAPDRAPATVLVVNAHLDHVSGRARREAARLLRRRIPAIAAGTVPEADTAPDDDDAPPTALVGDFNCTPGSDPHRILVGEAATGADADETRDAPADPVSLRDAATAAELRHGPATSLTDFTRLIDGRRIDHALVSPAASVAAFATLADRDDRGRYPSDHLPVCVRLTL